jgi:uncharacterized phage-associated protein
MVPFRFSLQKKIQAAGVILRNRGHMDRLRLLKLLYIADRESLRERGTPIVGGLMVAMDHGPLHSEIYDLIKGSHAKEAEWSEYIESEGSTVTLRNDPGRLDLSPYEIDKLNQIAERYQDVDTWALSTLTHDFEEWAACVQRGTSKPIPAEKLLGALGFDSDEIAGIVGEANAHARLVRMLGA